MDDKKSVAVCLAALMLLTLITGGCASLETPRISLSNLAITESTGFESVVQVQLRVLNPNDVDLNIQGVDCKLEINDKPFAYGISNTSVLVPAYGSATVPVTVYSSALDIARGLLSMQGREQLSYQLKGKIRLEGAGWLLSKLPFKSGGTVSLKDFEGWMAPRSP